MPARPLRLTRPALFRAADLEAVEECALRLLEEVGIEVLHPELAERARRKGLRFSDGRVKLPRAQVQAYIEETRGGRRKPRRRAAGRRRAGLSLHVSPYPLNVHDPESDDIVPFTAARLTDATRLVGALGERGVVPQAPGCPTDVPAPLQVISQYRIAAENLPGGGEPVDAKSLASLPYVMDMAEALGRPIRDLPVYVFSPLKLAGESLTAVMALEPRLESIRVGSMPAAGSTAPVRPGETFALTAAEIIGSAFILRECLAPKVGWGISAHPFDLRGMAMSFGSPEALLFEMASCEVDAYFHGEAWWPAAANIHTLAKLPGPQAAAEKESIMSVGALLGADSFYCAGALSLDEVFSPVQLVLDVELKDHAERLARGLDAGCDAEACLADVKAAGAQGFAGLDRTLDRYRDLYWHPHLFERRFLGPWQAAGRPGFGRQAWAVCRDLVARYEYEPPADIRAEIERIYRRAEQELAGHA